MGNPRHLPWSLSLDLAASFGRNRSHCRHFAWLDGLSTASVDSLHSTLEAVTRPLDCLEKQPYCVYVSSDLVTTFKVLYKKSTDTVDRTLIKPPMLQQG